MDEDSVWTFLSWMQNSRKGKEKLLEMPVMMFPKEHLIQDLMRRLGTTSSVQALVDNKE